MQEDGRIESLFKRGHGTSSFSTPFLIQLNQEKFREFIADEADGSRKLHAAALRRLDSEDSRTVARALIALMVVGGMDDIPAVEKLILHRDAPVRKAAKTCLFEIRRKPQ